jgi:hypothetical protein
MVETAATVMERRKADSTKSISYEKRIEKTAPGEQFAVIPIKVV